MRQILIVRKDLNMRKGKIAAQASHASMAFLLDKFDGSNPQLTDAEKEWIATGQTKICVGVDSETELLEICKKSNALNLPTYLITDSGRTEFDGVPTRTVLAVGPADEEILASLTGNLKLL